MEMTSTSSKNDHDIPMTKTQYEILKESFKDVLLRYDFTIDYDEDFQQAHICCISGALLEETANEYIFREEIWSGLIIDKRTGEIFELEPDVREFWHLASGIKRVYGNYDRDFISDELKDYLRCLDEFAHEI